MLQITSPSLEWVPPGLHTAEDLELITAADEAQPIIDRIPLLQIDHSLRMAKMQLFRVIPGPGVMLTEIRHAYGVKRLSLLRGSGKCAWQMRAILKLLGATAKEWGCEYVETVVYSPRLKRALELSGAEVEGYILRFAPEGDDGHEE
jgi:hypothetical protein